MKTTITPFTVIALLTIFSGHALAAENYGGIELPGVPIEITDPAVNKSEKQNAIKTAMPSTARKTQRAESPGAPSFQGDSHQNSANNKIPFAQPTVAQSQTSLAIVNMDVTPGFNQIVPISVGHLNRIVTPFDTPNIRSVSDVSTEVVKNVVYVATGDKKYTTLFITDESEETAISLTLAPKAIPPREIHLRVKTPQTQAAFAASGTKKAKRWEEANNYVEIIKKINSMIASGKTPPGYTLRDPAEGDHEILCYQSGLELELGQVLDGHNMFIQIYSLTNTSNAVVEVNETACYQPGVVAVSTWPRTILNTGEQTELIVTHSRELAEAAKISRPALVSY